MTLNVRELLAQLRHLTIHPEKWNQETWVQEVEDGTEEPPSACDTFGCLAGNTVLASGKELLWENYSGRWMAYGVKGEGSISDTARVLLGLTHQQASALFSPNNREVDLWRIAREITAGEIGQYDYEKAKREFQVAQGLKEYEAQKKAEAVARLKARIAELEN
jgi:hypothetical protein